MPENIKSQLSYDPETGLFRWLVNKNSYGGVVSVGQIAGTNKDGYIQIVCNQRKYRAHRLAWYYMKNEFPPKGFEIDHINSIRSDNRWSNLRLVTRSQNNMNMRESVANKSGAKGVSFRKDTKKWHARICVNRKVILLGNFVEFCDAVNARKEAEKKYFGEFAKDLS